MCFFSFPIIYFVTLILLTVELLKRLAIYEIIMSIIGKNIRKIRTVKKLSQAAFAEIFNLARPSVGVHTCIYSIWDVVFIFNARYDHAPFNDVTCICLP